MFAGRNFKRARLSKVWVASSLLVALAARGQGNFIYDQQSSDESRLLDGGDGVQSVSETQFQEHLQHPFLLGQTFTPSLNSIEFVRLSITSYANVPSTLRLELFATPTSSASLATSTSVTVASTHQVFADFYFTTPLAVIPGNTYFLHPESVVGTFGVAKYKYDYSGGAAYLSYLNGAPNVEDYWFREGIIAAPEPSAVSLVLVGGILFYVCRKKFQTCTTK
jgi:hypothetical protein